MEDFELEIKKSTLNELEDTCDEFINILHTDLIAEIDIDALFRMAHNLKGNSKAADFTSISTATHALEDLLIKKKDNHESISESFYELLMTYSESIQEALESHKKDISYMPNLDELEIEIKSFNEEKINKKSEESRLKKMLLIDDDIDIYNIVNKYVSDSFEIDYVSNAVQAIEDCKLQDYDLIICDYKMPVMNGQEFALYLRQGSSKNKETPMIFLTGHKPELFNQKSIWEDVFFMDKPIKKKKLEYYSKCALKRKLTSLKAS